MLPNLIMPGFTRSGTTWLYRVLREHPDVYLPYRKELHYFDRNRSRGTEWYERYFAEAGGERYRGDITPTYILQEHIAADIRNTIPGCKLIIVLRNPVDWLHSNYLKDDRERGVTRSFCELVEDRRFLRQHLYYPKVLRYFEQFGEQRIRVLYYEDLKMDPVVYLQQVTEFLEIEPTQLFGQGLAEIRRKENPTVRPRSMHLHRFFHAIVRVGRRLHWKKVDVALTRGRDVYRRFFLTRAQVEHPPVHSVTREIIHQTFHTDIAALSSLVGKDLLTYWGFSCDA